MNPGDIKQVGKWQVARLIGQGGMSWVFEVTDPRLGATRALKMLKPATANSAGYKGFLREARILASLDDDFLVRIYDFDQDPTTGNDYYVMELLSGSDLKQLLKRQGPLEPARAVDVFAGVLQALGKLHEQVPPIIHRDIKPGNIQITESGRPKLLDLGIAKVTRKNTDETVFDNGETLADMFKGTVLYASPEHLAMQEPGTQADVFAMGLCVYEALEGRHAYAELDGLPDPTSQHVTYQDVFRFYTRLEAVQGELKLVFKRAPKALRPVIQKALRIDPRDRFRDAQEMRAALLEPSLLMARDTVEVPVARAPKPAPAPVPRTETPNPQPIKVPRWLAPTVAAVVGLALASVAITHWPHTREQAAKPAPPHPAPARAAISPAMARPPAPPSAQPTPPPAPASHLPAAAETQPTSPPPALASHPPVAASTASTLPPAPVSRLSPGVSAQPTRPPAPVSGPPSVAAATAVPRPAPAAPRDPTQEAREEAASLNAAVNAPEAWQRALRARGSAAAAAFASARDEARAARTAALAQQKAAEGVRRDVAASCGDACRDGDAALALGRQALASNDFRSATPQFQHAAQAFDALASHVRLRVSVVPSGRIALVVGMMQRFQATTATPGATVRYSVQPPEGTPYTITAANFSLVPDRPGEYRISVIASHPTRPQSVPVVIIATASAVDHRPPETATAPLKNSAAKPVAAAPASDLADAKELLQQFRLAIESRDMSRLRALWKIDSKNAGDFRRLFDRADEIKVVAEPLAPIEPQGSDKGMLRFRQRVTATTKGESQDLVPLASYRAELVRRGDHSWQILSVKPE